MVNLVKEKSHKSLSVQESREHLGPARSCMQWEDVQPQASHRVGILEASDIVPQQWQNLYFVYNP